MDALLKIGFCNYELKNWPEARSALSQVASILWVGHRWPSASSDSA